MKLNKFLCTFCIFTLGISIIGCGSSTSKWTEAKTMNITHKTYNAGFNNENLGITVGYSGEVHYTTDGGESWPEGKNRSACRFGLDIVNESLAYNSGNGGDVRKTTDGGKTWSEIANYGGSEPNHCRYLSFLDNKNGWIANTNSLGTTNDGGASWKDIKLPDGVGKIECIQLLNEQQGYLVDDNKKLYTTKDGGATWENLDIKQEDIDTTIGYTPTMVVKFIDDNEGYIYYITTEKKVSGISTKNGGKTWKKEEFTDVNKGSLYLSKDAKYLTVTTIAGDKITLLKRNS